MSYVIRRTIHAKKIFQFFHIATLRVTTKHFRVKGFFEVTFCSAKVVAEEAGKLRE